MGRLIDLVPRPESTKTLSELAEEILLRAGAAGVLPTPVDELIKAADLAAPADPTLHLERFLASLAATVRDEWSNAIQKVRGIADLRERAIYVPADVNGRRERYVKAHELGHQSIPWHHVNGAYRDDDDSLRLGTETQELFDREANCFAAEVLFQGRRFQRRARDYRSSFEAVFTLADEHAASRHATLWRYVEEQDERLALVSFWPSHYSVDDEGYPVLRRGKSVGSPRFVQSYEALEVPEAISTGHPWVAARDLGVICDGDIALTSEGLGVRFEWQSWWNTYGLFVLLRRRPIFKVVGKLLDTG